MPFCGALVALLVGSASSATAYSTNADISVTRAFSPDTATPGEAVEVTITVDVGAIGADPVRGFFLSDHVPTGLSPTSGTVTLDGSTVAAVVETGEEGAVYAGCVTARWVLETPPAWSEGRPISASSTLVIRYQVTVPADAATGPISFPGFTWVAMIAAQGNAGDHFGYEDSTATITVTGGVDPGDPDGGIPGDGDGGGGNGYAAENADLIGGCASAPGRHAGALCALFALALLALRRRAQ